MNHEKIWNSLGRTERKRIAECAFLNLEDLLDLYENNNLSERLIKEAKKDGYNRLISSIASHDWKVNWKFIQAELAKCMDSMSR